MSVKTEFCRNFCRNLVCYNEWLGKKRYKILDTFRTLLNCSEYRIQPFENHRINIFKSQRVTSNFQTSYYQNVKTSNLETSNRLKKLQIHMTTSQYSFKRCSKKYAFQKKNPKIYTKTFIRKFDFRSKMHFRATKKSC